MSLAESVIIPQEVVRFLRKCTAKVMPPLCYRTVYSKAATDTLCRRAGLDIEKTSLSAKEISDQHCVILTSDGDKTKFCLRGFSDRGAPLWFEVSWKQKTTFDIIGFDPSALFTEKEPADLVLSPSKTTGSILLYTAKQGDSTKKIKALTSEEAREQLGFYYSKQTSFRDEIKFTREHFPYLRRLSLLAGISEYDAWLTITRNKEEVGSLWEGGENIICVLRTPMTGESEDVSRISPAAIRYLRWALSYPTESSEFVSLSLDAGERGGKIVCEKGGMSFSSVFSLEGEAYKTRKIPESEAQAYFRAQKEALANPEIKANVIDPTTLAKGLATTSMYVSETKYHDKFTPAVSVGYFGDSINSLCFVGKSISSRSIVYSPNGLPTKDYPSLTFECDQAISLSRLVRIYQASLKKKEITMRALKHNLMEGVCLGDDTAFSFLLRTKDSTKATLVVKTDGEELASFELDASFLDKAAGLLQACNTPLLRSHTVSIPGVLGDKYGDLIGATTEGSAILATGALYLLGRATSSTKAERDIFVVSQHDSTVATINTLRALLARDTNEDSLRLRISVCVHGSSGVSLNLQVIGKEKTYALCKLFQTQRIFRAEALDSLTRNVDIVPRCEPVQIERSKVEVLKRVLTEHCLSHREVGTLDMHRAIEAGFFDPGTNKIWMTNKNTALQIDPPFASSNPVFIPQYLPDLVSRLPIETCKYRSEKNALEVSGGGVSFITNHSELTPDKYPLGIIQKFFTVPDNPAVLGTMCGTITADVTMQRLLEALDGEYVKGDVAFWVWHKSGSWAIARTKTLGEANFSAKGTIHDWGAATSTELSDFMIFSMPDGVLKRSLDSIKEYLRGLGKTETILKLRLIPTRFRLTGQVFNYISMGKDDVTYTLDTFLPHIGTWLKRV